MKMIFAILFILFIFCFVRLEKAHAGCSSFYNSPSSVSGDTLSWSYTTLLFGCSYHAEQIRVNFVTDTTATYTLEYTLDNGTSWHSQYQGATNSATMTLLAGSSVGDTRTLVSEIDPSVIFPKDTGSCGCWDVNYSSFHFRVRKTDGGTFSASFVSFTPITSLDDAAVPIVGSSLSSANPIKVCDALDIACNVINGLTNAVNWLFGMPTHFASDQFTLVTTDLNEKVPFAYINAVFSTDVSNTASSTAIPSFTLPFAGGTILGHTISIPTTSYNFNSETGDALAQLRPYLNYGLYALLLGYFIYLAHSIF
jgi:hypothetical protein